MSQDAFQLQREEWRKKLWEPTMNKVLEEYNHRVKPVESPPRTLVVDTCIYLHTDGSNVMLMLNWRKLQRASRRRYLNEKEAVIWNVDSDDFVDWLPNNY